MTRNQYVDLISDADKIGDGIRRGSSDAQDVSGNVPSGVVWNSLNNIYSPDSTSPEHQDWMSAYNSNPFVQNQQTLQNLFNTYNPHNRDDYGQIAYDGIHSVPYSANSGSGSHRHKGEIDSENPFKGLSYYDSLKYISDHSVRKLTQDQTSSGLWHQGFSRTYTDIPGLKGLASYRLGDLKNYLSNTPIVQGGLTNLSTTKLNDLFNSGVWGGQGWTGDAQNNYGTFDNYLKSHPDWGASGLVDDVANYKAKVMQAQDRMDHSFRNHGLLSLGTAILGGIAAGPTSAAATAARYGQAALGAYNAFSAKSNAGKVLGAGRAIGSLWGGPSDGGASASDGATVASDGQQFDYSKVNTQGSGMDTGFNWDNVTGVGTGDAMNYDSWLPSGSVDTNNFSMPSYSLGEYMGFNPSSSGNSFNDLYNQVKNSSIVQNYLKPATMFAQQNAPLIKAGLGYIYSNQNAKSNLRRAQQQYDNINSSVAGLRDLYSPNSAYATQLQKELDARDAASGRRSQYGQRSVELAAKLADQQVRAGQAMSGAYNNMNQLGSYMDQLKNTPRNALASFAQPEVLKNLYDLF